MPERNIIKISLILFCCFVIFLFSCSTKKNTFTSRTYHNLTAHYNAYFNGKESLKEGTKELIKKNKDDFTKVLPVFEVGTKADAQSVYNYMDRAIEKASKVIQRHSMNFNSTEYVAWIEDAFMLIGKSYYYKQEYELALQTFNYVINKKFYHKDPKENTKYEAIIWKSRVLAQQGRTDDAEAVLNAIEKKIEKNKANKPAEKLYPLAYGDVLIKQEKYEQSQEYLLQALRLNKSKHTRRRISFILAQTFQRSGNPIMANKYYKKVLGMNPTYDMEFATKINLAKNYDITIGGSDDLKKTLGKMIRDEKNIEYLDQLYFALAEIYLKENDEERAIKYLKKSAQKSISNNQQKSMSYLKLADLYFSQPDYIYAQQYYDSCLITLSKDFPNYQIIENRANTLNDLVKNLKIVAMEDSLQMLSKLSPAERLQKVQEHISRLIEEEDRRRREETARLISLSQIQQINENNSQTVGAWYFYNPSAMSFGSTEFVRKWGPRKYEDLWRLSNKIVTDFGNNEPEEKTDSIEKAENIKKSDLKNPNTYLERIPLTPEAIEISDNRICEALFNIGIIYRESLDEPDKSIEAFHKLQKRYPDSKQIAATYYFLYQLYQEKEELPKANYYKDLLITKFPESDYAKIISDPNYYQKLEEVKGRLAKFYKDTYFLYKEGKYKQVINNTDSILALKNKTNFTSKFDYLKCLSIGKTQSKESFIDALKNIVKKYPESDVKKEAQAILDFYETPIIEENKAETKVNDSSRIVITKRGLYKYDPASFHFYIIVFDIKNVLINDLKIVFSNHNSKLFSSLKLSINTLFLDDKHEVLNVGKFENSDDAMNYLNSIENAQEILSTLGNSEYNHFIISSENYPVFYKDKNVTKYINFYNQHYLKQ